MDLTREAEARFAESGDRSEASRVLEPARDRSLDRVWDRIVELARPSARLVRASSAYGSSRLGGLPMVDTNFSWPADPDGQPLPFVGQIDLADVSRVCSDDIVPTDGLMALFYDSTQQPSGYQPTHRGRWAVNYSKSPSSLASPPNGANINIPEIQMTAVGDLTLPESDSIEIEKHGMSPDETDAYESLLDHLKGLHGAG